MTRFTKISLIACLITLVATTYTFALSAKVQKAKKQEVVLLKKPKAIANKKTLAHKKAHTKSYRVKGKRYHPQKHIEYNQVGIASYYGFRDKFHGKPTSTGEIFNANAMTAAHKSLPLPAYVRVTNLKNGRSVVLRVIDRGPFHPKRIIDVSEGAAKKLGFHKDGITKVRVETLVEETVALQNSGKRIA